MRTSLKNNNSHLESSESTSYILMERSSLNLDFNTNKYKIFRSMESSYGQNEELNRTPRQSWLSGY